VWVKTYSGNLFCDTIMEIHIRQDGLIVYSLHCFTDRTESELFPTKELAQEYLDKLPKATMD
jgi:hypothetical protein